MKRATITLTFMQIITNDSVGSFAQNIFNDSYTELLKYVQDYNSAGKISSLEQLIQSSSEMNLFHSKIATVVDLHIQQLCSIIPAVVDNAGEKVRFDNYQFQVLESHFTDKSKHVIAITYVVENLLLLEGLGDYMLLQKEGELHGRTFMIQMKEGVNITHWSVTEIPPLL